MEASVVEKIVTKMVGISESKMERYLATARLRKTIAERKRLQRFDRAWDIARQAARMLYERFNCGQVVAFGSILNPDLFHTHSDVDLAVWGIDESLYLQAVAAVTSLSSEILVDVIEIEDTSDSLRRLIEKEGQPL